MKDTDILYRLKKDIKIDYEIEPLNINSILRIPAQEDIVSYVVSYETPFKTGIIENDRVYSEFFISEKSNDSENIIILLHGFTSRLERLENYYNFITRAVENNLSCLFIHLPYHLKRTPPGEKSGQRMIQYKDIETLDFFNQSVLDIQKGILIVKDMFSKSLWNKKIPVQKLRFSICGLSLGGMISVTAMAWDKTIRKGVLIQCGGNWDLIYWNSLVRVILRGSFINKEKIKRKQAREFYLPIHEFIKEYKKIEPGNIGYGLAGYQALSRYPQKTWFLSDPLTFAHKIGPGDVMMINSRFDILFCKESVVQLWKELGKPEIYWLNDFHSSGVLNNRKVLRLIFNFLNNSHASQD